MAFRQWVVEWSRGGRSGTGGDGVRDNMLGFGVALRRTQVPLSLSLSENFVLYTFSSLRNAAGGLPIHAVHF